VDWISSVIGYSPGQQCPLRVTTTLQELLKVIGPLTESSRKQRSALNRQLFKNRISENKAAQQDRECGN
jgi:UDP-N-acetyl-D-mannosaminuronate dehydrogenase